MWSVEDEALLLQRFNGSTPLLAAFHNTMVSTLPQEGVDDDPYFRDHGRRRAAREQRRRAAREQGTPQSEAAAAVTAVSVAGSFVVGQGSQRVCAGESNCVCRSCCRSRRQRRRAIRRGLPYAPATPLRSGGAHAPAPLLQLLSVPVGSPLNIGFSSLN